MSCPRARVVAVVLSSFALGCSATVPPRPVGLPPTPRTVTVQNPGGDAADPGWAALDRLAREPWGVRRDRTNTLLIPLADALHWTRVRLWGYPTRTAFRFGDDHHGVIAIWYGPTTGPDDPESCLGRFLAEARPIAESYGTRVLSSRLVHTVQRPSDALRAGAAVTRGGDPPSPAARPTPQAMRPMVVQVIDAEVAGFLSSKVYAGAIASYPSWPGTCLIQGFAVPADEHQELATRVRDRWVAEAAPRLVWHPRLTEPPSVDDR